MCNYTVITSGSSYLDIDAYACCIALSELKNLLGYRAIAYSSASVNSSVSKSLLEYKNNIFTQLPSDCDTRQTDFIIVDISDPNYIEDVVPLDRIITVYDHHTGFEEFWREKIGEGSNIQFIGSAATLVYNEWVKSGKLSQMSSNTAKLLLAGILDNTLNLYSSNTTELDVQAKNELCKLSGVGSEWCQRYFREVQLEIENDLKKSLLGDVKHIRSNDTLPSTIGQLVIWDANSIINRLDEIAFYFNEIASSWLVNVVDICYGCSYFLCNDGYCKEQISRLFDVKFVGDVAKLPKMFLRKEILKIAKYLKN